MNNSVIIETNKNKGKTAFMIFCHIGLALFAGMLMGLIYRVIRMPLHMEYTNTQEETMQLYFIRTLYKTVEALFLPVTVKLIHKGLCQLNFKLNRKLLAILISAALFAVFRDEGFKFFFIGLVVAYVSLELPVGWAYGMCILAAIPGWIRYYLCEDIHTVTVAMQNVSRAEMLFEELSTGCGVAAAIVSFRIYIGKEKVKEYFQKLLGS